MTDTLPRYLTTKESATLLRVAPETLRFWRYKGTGPKSFKVGKRVLYALEDVQAFVDQAREAV